MIISNNEIRWYKERHSLLEYLNLLESKNQEAWIQISLSRYHPWLFHLLFSYTFVAPYWSERKCFIGCLSASSDWILYICISFRRRANVLGQSSQRNNWSEDEWLKNWKKGEYIVLNWVEEVSKMFRGGKKFRKRWRHHDTNLMLSKSF